MKTCAKCNIEKELEEFHKDRRKKDGLCCQCKNCIKEYQKKYQKENTEKIKQLKKVYRQENREKIREGRKEHYENNKEVISQKGKEYREQNEDKIKQRKIEYYKKNREKIKEHNKENKEQKKEYNKKYQKENKSKRNEQLKERYKNDPIYRLKQCLRSLNYKVIKKGYKSASTQKLLGCTWEEAIIYIENQFLPGMSWENWTINGWHLDHIKPIAAFADLDNPEQQRQCFHFTNFRPMWADDNYSKSSWYNGIKYSKKTHLHV